MDAWKVAVWAWAWAVWLWVVNEALKASWSVDWFAGWVASAATTVADTVWQALDYVKEIIPGDKEAAFEWAQSIGFDNVWDLALWWLWGVLTLAFLLGWNKKKNVIKNISKSIMIASILWWAPLAFWAGLTAWATKHFYDGLGEGWAQK